MQPSTTDAHVGRLHPCAAGLFSLVQYGALRTANYRKGQWRNTANWRNAFTMGGAKATAGALGLMGMSMAFDTLISTPLEKKYVVCACVCVVWLFLFRC